MIDKIDGKKLYTKLTSKTSVYILALLVFSGIAFFFNPILGACQLGIVFILAIYRSAAKKKRHKEIVKYIEKLSFYVNSATKDSLLNFPEPMVIITAFGSIAWYNQKFSDISGREELFEEQIQTIVPQISLDKILENKDNISFTLEYKNKFYSIMGNVTEVDDDSEKNFLIVLYWTDRTDEHLLLKQYNNERIVECILMIDNYDDVFQSTPDASKAALSAAIENKINAWIESVRGISRKFERDKFLILFEEQNLPFAITKKFDILDGVREINEGNKIPVTLSLGLGKHGKTIKDSDNYARLALEMALGRGGDQAIIKDSQTFHYYGAKTREFEKRTKVKARVVAHALRELIEQSDKVIIMGHQIADMDSIGASIGLFRGVKNIGKDAYLLLNNINSTSQEIMKFFKSKPEYNDFIVSGEQASNLRTSETLVIVVDTHRPSFVEHPLLLDEAERVVLIDHHRRGAEFLENAALIYHEPYASSTCEMVTEILQYMQENTNLKVEEAEALYSGIVMDTKNFTVKTGVRTFEAASYLRRLGVDTIKVRQLFQNNLNDFIRRSQIISRAKMVTDNIAISAFESAEHEPQFALVAQAADELLNIKGITASFVIGKSNNLSIISGRSMGSINVQVILEKLGGGGHMGVAGAQLEGSSLAEVESMLIQAINDAVENG